MQTGMSEIRQAIEKKNLKDAIFHSHKLRGLMLTIGATPAADICRKIESTKTQEELAILAILGDAVTALERETRRSMETVAAVAKTFGT
jgi:HPt (histidine-containing phosphotransfer) domain-containing protein